MSPGAPRTISTRSPEPNRTTASCDASARRWTRRYAQLAHTPTRSSR
jgi:hypothetical protein